MIHIDHISNYSFQFGFNQTQELILNSLEKEFLKKHGKDFFNSCSLIIIVENQTFYHVLRNKLKRPISGELMENLCVDIYSHLNI